MFLKRTMQLIPGANRKSSRLFFFYLNVLPSETKILTISKASFHSNQFLSQYDNFYSCYMSSKPDSYPNVFYAEKLKNEVKNSQSSFKLLNDLPVDFEKIENVNEHIQDIATKFNSYDINELCEGITFLSKEFPLSKNKNVKELLKCLDEELWKRVLTTEELLNTLAVIKYSGFLRTFTFPKKGAVVLFRRISRLSLEQIVQVFFLVKKQKWQNTDYKFSVISCILSKFSQLNLEELGIIACGFMKVKFKIHQEMASSIFNKLNENIENLQEVPLQSICKALQKLTSYLNAEDILNLQEKIIPCVSNLDTLTLIECMNLGRNNVCINPSFRETAIMKLKENISDLSSFLLVRLVGLIGIYNIQDEELLMMAVREYEKLIDVEKHPIDLVYFCYYLTNCRIYSKALLDLVLSEKFVKENVLSGKNRKKLGPYWWILYCHLEIEKPEYLNYKLEINERLKLHKIFTNFLYSLDMNQKYNSLKAHIIRSLIDLYGENAVAKTFILPQYEKGLVLRFNKDLEAQPIPEEFFNDSVGSFVKKPLDTDHYWVFLNILLRYSCEDDLITESGFGFYKTQCRQLKAFGYIPILVSQDLYKKHKIHKTHVAFITDNIKKSLNEFAESGKRKCT